MARQDLRGHIAGLHTTRLGTAKVGHSLTHSLLPACDQLENDLLLLTVSLFKNVMSSLWLSEVAIHTVITHFCGCVFRVIRQAFLCVIGRISEKKGNFLIYIFTVDFT